MKNDQKISNIFKNSGIRDKANTNLLTSKSLQKIIQAISIVCLEEFEEYGSFIIGTDTRQSSPAMKKIIIDTLTELGHDVYDAGICPTPCIAKVIKDFVPCNDAIEDSYEMRDADDEPFFTLGIMVTASHNPEEYNGIKILTDFGYLNNEQEELISQVYFDLLKDPSILEEYYTDQAGSAIDFNALGFYEWAIQQSLEHIPLHQNKPILLDLAYGATSVIAPQLFESCGLKTINTNKAITTSQINHESGTTHPKKLLSAMQQHDVDWGCSFDGDGDRVIIAHKNGTIFDGDDIAVMLMNHPLLEDEDTVVGTVMTNSGVERYLKQHNITIIRTDVGERNIIEQLIKKQATLGTETCGHITLMSHAFCSDGIFAALLFFDVLEQYPAMIEQSYEKDIQINMNISLHGKNIDTKTINQLLLPYKQEKIRIIARKSNTEPVLRIMVEASDQTDAQVVLNKLEKDFLNFLGSI